MPRTPGAKTSTVSTRVSAVRLVRSGFSQTRAARDLGVSQSAVSRWVRLARTGGLNALSRPQRSPRQRRLAPEGLKALRRLLRKPPEAYGLRGGGWTVAKIADLVRRELCVRYHPSHVWKVLRAHGVRYD